MRWLLYSHEASTSSAGCTAPLMTSTSALTQNLSAPPALHLDRIAKLYAGFVALRDVSLSLPVGSSVMLLGPNGSGKSTLLKLLAGLSRPSYGNLHVFGRMPEDGRGRIAYMGHSSALYDELTVAENLRYFLGLQRPELPAAQRKQRMEEAVAAMGLDPGNPRRVGEYSQGMRQRASLARALLTDPDLLLLDEPFSNLDTGSVRTMLVRLRAYLAQPSASGLPRTLLLTTHQAELARPLTTQTLTLEDGRLVHVSANPSHAAGSHVP